MIYYSKSINGFYDTQIEYKNIPDDAVEISAERHRELLVAQSNGRCIVSDDAGYPMDILPEPIVLTWEDIKKQRNFLLKDTDWIDLPNSPIKNKQKWLEYRQMLRDIPQKFKSPNDVVWPATP